MLESIEKNGGANCFREKTGLPISTYFSAVKFKWMYDHIPEVKVANELAKHLLFSASLRRRRLSVWNRRYVDIVEPHRRNHWWPSYH